MTRDTFSSSQKHIELGVISMIFSIYSKERDMGEGEGRGW